MTPKDFILLALAILTVGSMVLWYFQLKINANVIELLRGLIEGGK